MKPSVEKMTKPANTDVMLLILEIKMQSLKLKIITQLLLDGNHELANKFQLNTVDTAVVL